MILLLPDIAVSSRLVPFNSLTNYTITLSDYVNIATSKEWQLCDNQ